MGFAVFLVMVSILAPPVSANVPTCPDPPTIGFTLTRIVRRSRPAFTEGLVFRYGMLFESSGKYGRSEINAIEIPSGRVTSQVKLPDRFFAEGLDVWGGDFLLLTWKERSAFFWNDGLSAGPQVLRFPHEGWGLTHDANLWITSDGTSTLKFMGRSDLAETRSLEVYRGSEPQDRLNELEYIEGKIFANVFRAHEVIQINPRDGCVEGVLDLLPLIELLPKDLLRDSESVANGIAFDPERKVLFVTGKNWPFIFELRLDNPLDSIGIGSYLHNG